MLAATGVVVVPVTAAAIEPVLTAGNPTCADAGFSGFKIDRTPVVGRYDVTGLPGVYVEVLAVRNGGRAFDWASNFGLDQVIVKGGDSANVYSTNDARSGTDYRSPVNSSGSPAKISHVEFCYDGIERPTITADGGEVAGARGVAIDDIPLTTLPASLVNLVAGADLVNDAGTGLRFSDADVQYTGTGLRFSGTGLRFSGTGLRFSGTGLRFSGTSIRFSGTGLRFSGTGLRFSGTGLRFSDSGVGTLLSIRSAGTGLRFSGTGLRFSGTGMRFSDLPGWDVQLSELQPPEGFTWDDVFVALDTYVGYPTQNVTFGQLLDALDREFPDPAPEVIEALATMSLLDLDPNGAVLRDVSLVGLLLGSTPLSDIPLPGGQPWCSLIDPSNTGCTDAGTDTQAGIGDATVLALNLAGLRSDNIPLDRIVLDSVELHPDSVFADLLDDAGTPGDPFVPAQPADTLATYLLRGIDALNVPWEQLPLATDFDVRKYALGERVTFTAAWAQIGNATTSLSVTPPAGFVAAAEGVQCVVSSGTCTVASAGLDAWNVTVSGGTGMIDVEVTVAYRPTGLYGTTSPPGGGTFEVIAGPTSGSFGVTVVDPWAGQDPPPIEADVLYFARAAAGDVDRYDVDVSEYAPGSHVAVRLSNLTDDADLVLYRSAGTGLRFSGTGMRFSGTGLRFSGTGMRFSGDTGASGVDNLEPETLEDVPIDPDRLVEDVSANRATTPEAAEGFTDPETTNFEVQVSGFNQADTDYVVRVAVTEFADDCFPSGSPSASVSFGPAAGANTAVLFAPGRFGAADRDAISSALSRLAGFWPITVGTVATSGPDWTTETGICSVSAANAVAESVAAQVAALADSNPTIEHVMIIGGDDKLPFYRTPDTTLIANEANYASTVGGVNPVVSAFSTQHLLTDDIYGDDDPWPFLNRLYFTPERGVGRLVESTDDIVGQIDRFIASNGIIDVDRAFTAAYDFLADVGVEIDANLADVTSDRASLISDLPNGGVDDWSAAQLEAGLAGNDDGAGLSVIAVQAHMDQGLWLTALGDAQGGTPAASEVVGPEILPSGIAGAVVFTAGCHAGLNQPYPNARRTDDWAESLAGGPAAFYLANTGYGYGLDQPGIAYSEALLAEFSDLLELDGLTVGRATALSKQAFFADQLEIDPYDEKSQMQLVVYGVPMYSLSAQAAAVATSATTTTTTTTTTAAALAATPTTDTVADPVTGQASSLVDVGAAFSPVPGADGTSFYGIDSLDSDGLDSETGFEVSNGNPIQPKVSFDVTAADPALVARGAMIEQMSSSQVPLANPTIARAVIDSAAIEQPTESGVSIFPTAFTNVHTEQTADGPRGRLVVVPAQYDSTDVGKEQLLIDSMSVRTYYAATDQADVVRPQFRGVSAGVLGDDILFRVEIEDPAGVNVTASGVDRVLVQYFDGADWNPVELFSANAARTEWSGGLKGGMSLTTGTGLFFVQAVDGAGNVAVSANKGENYGIDGTPAKVVAFVSGTQGDDGWYVEPPTVELVGSAVTFDPPSHAVTIADAAAFDYVAPFQIDDEGISTVQVDGEGALPISFDVKVDTRAPTVDLATPIVVVYPGDSVTPASIETCADPVPGSGLRDLDPESDRECLLSTDSYSLTLVGRDPIGPFELSSLLGRDIAGNTTTESQSAVVLDGTLGTNDYFTSPVILGILGAAADDARVGLDGAEPTPYLSPITVTQTTTVVVVVGDDRIEFDVSIDNVAPTVTVDPIPNGTYEIGSIVPVTCSFGDGVGGSGLASVACGGTTGSTEGTLSGDLHTATVGTKTFVATATDAAGNTTTRSYTYTVADTRAPTIVVAPEPGGSYLLGAVVTVTCSFTDPAPGSGLASVACGGTTGTSQRSLTVNLDTATPGLKTFTATATDAAGNTAPTRSFTYEVVDPLCDPRGDVPNPNADIVRCRSVVNSDRTATLSLIVDGQIANDRTQYRLRVASSADQVGALVRWSEGKTTGRELRSVTVSGNRIDFVIDLARVGVAPGGTLYWYGEVQEGVQGAPAAGFLDRAPDTGWFTLVT